MDGRELLRALAVPLLLLAVFAGKGILVEPPAPPATAPAGAFDTERALARLKRILGDERPHPVDSPPNDAVRDRLTGELRAIGLQPRIQEAMDCSAMPKSRAVSCSRVRNVIATLGDGPGRHVLLNAHYDSTPAGPGAADDGLGVAAMLEVAALLQTSPPKRPVSFLFNEGEEFGLNGASAFVLGDPLAKQVDSLVNIEARGVSGPAMMFETSDPNGSAIKLFGNASRRPFANSLSMDFAKLIPNTTDVVEFRPAGWTMLNYAIIGNETRYHTPGDTIAALDRASLHHAGSEVLAATRALAAGSPRRDNGQWVFTDIGGGRLFVRLPLAVAAAGLAALLLGTGLIAYRRRALGKPLLLAAAMVAAGIAAAAVTSIAAGFVRAGDYWRAWPLLAYLAVYASLLLAMGALWARWGRRYETGRWRAAAWLLVILAGALVSLPMPGATIYFLAAPALALSGLALERRAPGAATALIVAAIIVQLLMFAELLALIETLLIDGPLWAVAPLAALATLPILAETPSARPRVVLVAMGAVAAGLWAAALLAPRTSGERPGAFTIDYFRDGPRAAHWAIASKQAPLPRDYPGEWRKQVLPYSQRTRWVSPAPMLDVPRPSARLLRIVQGRKGRRVWLALSPGGGNSVSLRFEEAASVEALGLPGQPIAIPAKGEPEKAMLRCSGRACDGLVVEVRLADRSPVVAELFATRFELPAEGAPLAAARPPDSHPQYGPDSSIRLHRVRF